MLVGLEALDSQSQQGVWTLKGKKGNTIGLSLTPVYLFVYLNCHKRLIYMFFRLMFSAGWLCAFYIVETPSVFPF